MILLHRSISKRICGFALFAIVASGAACLPALAVPQVANPTAPIKSAEKPGGQAALPAQPGQVKREEAEEYDVYRHTALVGKLAKVFHLDIETMARIFEWINTAIILLLIVLPLAKVLPNVFRKRAHTLAHDLETARKTTADANTRLGAVEAQLARLDDEIAKIRAQVEEESKQDEARIKASLHEESARILATAEQEIAAAASHAQRELRHFATDLAVENAAKHLALTPETDRVLISEFIAQATNGTGKGGRS